MSNPLAAINKGEAIHKDPQPDMFGRPANRTAAIFIGIPAMNASSASFVHARAPQLELLGCRKPIDARHAGAVSEVDRIEVEYFLDS